MANTPLTTEQILERAKLAQAVYNNNKINNIIAENWKVIYTTDSLAIKNNQGKLESLSQFGFYAEAYQNIKTGEIKIVSRGTEKASIFNILALAKDGLADAQLSLKLVPTQLQYAIRFTEEVANKLNINISSIEQVGHSLGGNLGNTVAMLVGAKAFGINSPGFVEILKKIGQNQDNYFFVSKYKDNLTDDAINQNANNITILNTTGDKISDVNNQLGNIIENRTTTQNS